MGGIPLCPLLAPQVVDYYELMEYGQNTGQATHELNGRKRVTGLGVHCPLVFELNGQPSMATR